MDRMINFLLMFSAAEAPMDKWIESTFYSATANEVSNGKMD